MRSTGYCADRHRTFSTGHRRYRRFLPRQELPPAPGESPPGLSAESVAFSCVSRSCACGGWWKLHHPLCSSKLRLESDGDNAPEYVARIAVEPGGGVVERRILVEQVRD